MYIKVSDWNLRLISLSSMQFPIDK